MVLLDGVYVVTDCLKLTRGLLEVGRSIVSNAELLMEQLTGRFEYVCLRVFRKFEGEVRCAGVLRR